MGYLIKKIEVNKCFDYANAIRAGIIIKTELISIF